MELFATTAPFQFGNGPGPSAGTSAGPPSCDVTRELGRGNHGLFKGDLTILRHGGLVSWRWFYGVGLFLGVLWCWFFSVGLRKWRTSMSDLAARKEDHHRPHAECPEGGDAWGWKNGCASLVVFEGRGGFEHPSVPLCTSFRLMTFRFLI